MSNPIDDGNLLNQIFGDQAVDNDGTKDQAPDAGEPEKQQKGTEPLQQQQQQDQEPDWKEMLAGRFSDPKELAKAFRELEKWDTKLSQEAAAYRRQVEQLQQQLQQLQQAAAPDMTKKQQEEFQSYVKKAINAAVVDEDPTLLIQLIDQFTDAKTEQKIRQIMPVIEPIARQNVLEQHVQEFFAENPEAQELEGEMAKLVQQEPDLVYDAKGNVRPNWTYRVYAKVLKQKSSIAKKISDDAAAQAAAAKAAAAPPGSTARSGQPQPESEEDRLKKVIFGEGGKRRMFDF